MIFRKAEKMDLEQIEEIYSLAHTEEEEGRSSVGWIRGQYPTRATAEEAFKRGDLFVAEDAGRMIGTAIINQRQVDVYKDGKWLYDAPEDQVMVLHTFVISPRESGRGYGKRFVGFYEEYAKKHGCPCLRMDTNEKNGRARDMYKRLGYHEVGIVPCTFQGIEGVRLVLLEKKLPDPAHEN